MLKIVYKLWFHFVLAVMNFLEAPSPHSLKFNFSLRTCQAEQLKAMIALKLDYFFWAIYFPISLYIGQTFFYLTSLSDIKSNNHAFVSPLRQLFPFIDYIIA